MSPKLSGNRAHHRASRGIGKSVAEAFAREGARLFLVGCVDEATLRQTLAEMRESGERGGRRLIRRRQLRRGQATCRCHRSTLWHARHTREQCR